MRTTSIPRGWPRARMALGFVLAIVIVAGQSSRAGSIVGYINVTVREGNNLLTNPLRAGAGAAENAIAEVMRYSSLPNGTCVFLFDAQAQSYRDAVILLTIHTNLSWYSSSGVTNDPAIKLRQGEGFAVQIPKGALGGGTTNVTLVGEFTTGVIYTNPIPGFYSLKGNMLPPFSGPLQTAQGFPARPGDFVWRGDAAAQTFTQYSYQGSGANWSPAQPSINVAEAFFIQRDPAYAGAAHWWTNGVYLESFSSPVAMRTLGVPAEVTPSIMRLQLEAGAVMLEISNLSGAVFDVQFSSDEQSWATIAAQQTGNRWSGPFPGGERGYYRLVNH